MEKKGKRRRSLKMHIEIFPAVVRFILWQKVPAVFRKRGQKGRPGRQIFRLPSRSCRSLPGEEAAPTQGILEEIAAVVSVRVVKIIVFILSGFQPEVQQDKRLVIQRAGLEKTKGAKLI